MLLMPLAGGKRKPSSITDFFNGFNRIGGDSFTGGATVVMDNAGALVISPLNVLAVQGARYAAGWQPASADGSPLWPGQTVKAKRGSMTKYGNTYRGFLNEPARTNYWLFSEPRLTDVTVSGAVTEVAVAERGLSRWLRVEKGGTDSYVSRSLAITAGDYIFSVFVKMDDGGDPFVGASGAGAGVDFSLLIEGNSTAGTAALAGKQSLGGGLWRLWGYRNVAADTTSTMQIRKYASQSNRSFTVTGFDLQKGLFPTSYIPTTSAAVTRAATVCSRPAAGVLRSNDWGVWGRVVPGFTPAGLITDVAWSSYVDGANNARVLSYNALIRFGKRVSGVLVEIASSLVPVSGAPFEYQVYQSSIYGMGIRTKVDGGVWSAFATLNDANARADAVLSTAYQIGALNGGAHFAGSFPFTAIIQHADPKAELERLAVRYP